MYEYLDTFQPDDELVFRRETPPIKFIGQPDQGRVGGYLVVWGSPSQKDLQGEYFTPETELGLNWYDKRPVLYHHGLDGDLQAAVIGVMDTLKADSTGVWAEAQLDIRKKYVQAVLALIHKGVLGWSSGSLPHLVEVEPDGRIKRWPIVEGSATPSPAEPRKTTISAIKSALILAAKEPPAEEQSSDSAQPDHTQATRTNAMDLQTILNMLLAALQQAKPDVALTPEESAALIAQVEQQMSSTDTATMSAPEVIAAAQPMVGKAFMTIVNQRLAASKAVADAVKAETEKFIKAQKPNGGLAQHTGSGGNGERQQRNPGAFEGMGQLDRRFDHLKATEMALGYVMLKKLKKGVSDDYLTAMAYKTAQLVERDDKVANDWAVKSQLPAIKANEVMQVNLANFGAEYAHTYFSSEVWQAVRQETLLYDRMLAKGMDEREVPAGYKSDTVPLEGGDMTWYNAGGGATDEDASSGNVTPVTSSSKIGTGQKEVTLARLSARGYWEKELEEDSIVNIVSEARRKIMVSGKEQVEMILANGDTDMTASTNINLIDGTPAAAPNKPSYTLLDGMAKLPLVTNTANVYNAANTLNEAVYLNLLPLLGTDGKYAADPENILFLVTNGTYFASLALAVLKTQDVFPSATIVEGVLRKIWGVELIRSAQFGNAQATGKISGTPANNTFGRILLARPDQWATRWKREIEIYMTFDDNAYVTRLTAHMRWGAGYRDTEASAIARNVNNAIV